MAMIKWDPFRDADTLDGGIDRMFEELFPEVKECWERPACAWTPAADFYRTADGVAVCLDLPGVAKDAVSVEVENNVLIVSGRRQADPVDGETGCFQRERCFGTFRRTFTLQSAPSPDRVRASLKNGVLTVHLPLPANETTRQVRVDVD